jgi:hypothetical protein
VKLSPWLTESQGELRWRRRAAGGFYQNGTRRRPPLRARFSPVPSLTHPKQPSFALRLPLRHTPVSLRVTPF